MKFVVSKIEWVTDGKRIPGLPKEMTIEINDDDLDWEDLDSLVVDAASDRAGYLIAGADVKACAETAPDSFDALAFNERKPTKAKVHRTDVTTAIENLGRATCRTLKKNAERAVKVAKPEVMRISFQMRDLDPQVEPSHLTRKVDDWVTRGSRFIYILETDADILFLDSAQSAFARAKTCERGGRAYARLNNISKVLYVGSSSSLGRRFREHLGYGARGTYALHLSHWARSLFINISLVAARYPAEVDPEVLGLMEDQLWDTLEPMFGRRGRR